MERGTTGSPLRRHRSKDCISKLGARQDHRPHNTENEALIFREAFLLVEVLSRLSRRTLMPLQPRLVQLMPPKNTQLSQCDGQNQLNQERNDHRLIHGSCDSRTSHLSDPAPLILDCQPKRYQRVRCIWSGVAVI